MGVRVYIYIYIYVYIYMVPVGSLSLAFSLVPAGKPEETALHIACRKGEVRVAAITKDQVLTTTGCSADYN